MEYTVTDVLGPSEAWSNEHGTYTPYAFKLQGVDKIVRWNRKHKDGSAPPGPGSGEVLEGELEDKGNYLKFKKTQGQGGGGFRGGGGGGKSPEQQKSIVRQHSAEMALRYCEIQALRGKLPDDFTIESLKPIINWFVRDAGGES